MQRSGALLAGLVLAVAGVGVIVWLAFTLLGLRNRADVLQAVRASPSSVDLTIASCNQEPFVDELEQTAPGTYEVLVRARLSSTGDDCADGVSIEIDPGHAVVTIIDRTSGTTFELLGTGEPAPLGLNGTWRMVTVDGGEQITVGRTTEVIPEIRIDAGQQSGLISGNFGCNTLTIEVNFADGTIVGRPKTLRGTEVLCTAPTGSDELVLTERSLLELLSGQVAELYLAGDHLEIGTRDTNAVFERVAP